MDALVNYSLIINEVKLLNHKVFGESFTIDPQIHRRIETVDKTKSAVTYVLEIKNTPEHPFPVDIVVSITGVFDISKLKTEDVDYFLKVQTCQILFPQIRTIVATLTSSALMHPILLPVIDAKKLFQDEKPQDVSECQ